MAQHPRHRLGGPIHTIEVAIAGGAHHLAANDVHLVFGRQVAGGVVVGDDAAVFYRVVDGKQLVEVLLPKGRVFICPSGIKGVEQRIACRRHLVFVEDEDGLHLRRSSLGFSV